MNIVTPANVEVINPVHQVKTGVVYNTPNAIAVHITLEAGERLKRHQTPVDVFFYVLEGEPTIEIGEEKQRVAADHLVESPANITHCLYNETDARARILVVKTPKPTAETTVL